MIEGYRKSMENDKINNVYNPFVSGKWNYKELKKELTNKINSVYIEELDNLFYSMPELIWR